MKHIYPLIYLIAALFPALRAAAQTIEIANWQGNMAGAVSLTFDDSLAGHWSHADPIMTAAGVRGTFFVITGAVDWDGARAAALNGHEIGSHSTVNATLQNDASGGLKLQQSHDAIEAQIGSAVPGYQCHSIAWPYGDRREDLINDPAYNPLYLSARLAGKPLLADNSYNAADVTKWWKYGLGDFGDMHYFVREDALMRSGTSLATFEAQLDLVEAQNAWTAFTYHGIETGGYENISAAAFTDQVAAAASRMGSTLWVAPYGEVIRYIRERVAATATVTGNDGMVITISLTDGLDDTVYDIPLTLMFDAPAGWNSVLGTQGGVPIPVSIEGLKVIFNAVPDDGTISLSNAGSPGPVAPVVAIAPLGVNTMQLSWDSAAGIDYEILQSGTLSSWESFDPPIIVTGNGDRHDVPVPYMGPRQFFQVEASLPDPPL